MSTLENIMGAALNVEDAAGEFTNPPAGLYNMTIKSVKARIQDTDNGEVPVVDIQYVVDETVELTKEGTAPVPNGSLMSESFWLNEKGKPYFIRYAVNILGEAMDGLTLQEIVDSLEGVAIQSKVTYRESKDGFINSGTRNQLVL